MSLAGRFPIDKWSFNSEAILADLPAEELKAILHNSREKKYGKKELIFREGDKPTGIYIIHSGRVKKYKIDNNGKEHIFYVANAGELIGYHALLAEEYYPDSAETLEDSTISFVPKAAFLAALDKYPTLYKRLLRTLSHEFGVLINSSLIFAQRPVKERIAIALIILREKYKSGMEPGKPVMITVSRSDIANMAGTTRENITRVLAEFKEAGIITTNGRKIMINDVQGLINISNYSVN